MKMPVTSRRARSCVLFAVVMGLAVLVTGCTPTSAIKLLRPHAYDAHFLPLPTPVGFGASTTGASGGAVYHVTTAADDAVSPKPGSLRYALKQPIALWIVFDGSYTIHLQAGLHSAPNKTVDGRGRHVTITGHGTWGFQLYNTHNIILTNLTLTDFGDTALTASNNKPDAIEILSSYNVWVDHCSLSQAGDKLIAIAAGSRGITLSWNHFTNQQQTVQIGDMTTARADAATTVTVHHDYFDRTGYRNPVASYGKVHVYNNYVRGWEYFGARSERLAQMYLEANVFSASNNRAATKVLPGGDGCNDPRTLCDPRAGYLASVANLTLNGAVIHSNAPRSVFQPSHYYPYVASAANSALVSAITAGAGAH
jgi:pectate lyase